MRPVTNYNFAIAMSALIVTTGLAFGWVAAFWVTIMWLGLVLVANA